MSNIFSKTDFDRMFPSTCKGRTFSQFGNKLEPIKEWGIKEKHWEARSYLGTSSLPDRHEVYGKNIKKLVLS
jgi:hypothetical protein